MSFFNSQPSSAEKCWMNRLCMTRVPLKSYGFCEAHLTIVKLGSIRSKQEGGESRFVISFRSGGSICAERNVLPQGLSSKKNASLVTTENFVFVVPTIDDHFSNFGHPLLYFFRSWQLLRLSCNTTLAESIAAKLAFDPHAREFDLSDVFLMLIHPPHSCTGSSASSYACDLQCDGRSRFQYISNGRV